jgi:microcystin-dependent protein
MSFGGNSSSFTLPHTHNNSLANDGGALSQTLTFMGGVTLYSLITAADPQTATNTAAIATNAGLIATNTTAIAANATAIAANTANLGKWSTTNSATFRTSVIAGVQVGTIEEVT